MPDLYIITGSNGAGKSTIGPTYLPAPINQTIFDGDKLFVQKRNELWKQIKAPKEVRNLAWEHVVQTFEQQVALAIAEGRDYAYEGHFTNDATWDIPKRFKEAGYTVNLIFFGLRDPDTSELRVIDRSKEGGHWVDRRTIEDNFYGNLEKLDKHAALIDHLQIIDTSEVVHIPLATFRNGEVASAVPVHEFPSWFTKYLPGLTLLITREQQTS